MDLGGIRSQRQVRQRPNASSRTSTTTSTSAAPSPPASFLTPLATPFTTFLASTRKRPFPPSQPEDAEQKWPSPSPLPSELRNVSLPSLKVERQERMTDVHSHPQSRRRMRVEEEVEDEDLPLRLRTLPTTSPVASSPAPPPRPSLPRAVVPFVSIRELRRLKAQETALAAAAAAQRVQMHDEEEVKTAEVTITSVVVPPTAPRPDPTLYAPLIVLRPVPSPLTSPSSVNYKRFHKVRSGQSPSRPTRGSAKREVVATVMEGGGEALIDRRLAEAMRREEEMEQITADMADDDISRVKAKRKR